MNTPPRNFNRSTQRLSKVGLILIAAITLIFFAIWANSAQAATVVVTNTNDSGAGSLRNAIATATVSDTIEFDASLNGQTIVLASQISISQDAKIVGNVPITLSGGNTNRIFYIEPDGQGVNFEIEGLTLMHGGIITEDGGAIYMDSGLLTIKNSTIYSNTAEDGAGIYVEAGGTIYVYTSTISANVAESYGGGIYSSGPLHIKNSQVISNSSGSDGGGLYSDAGILKLDNTLIYSNTTGSNGGGIYGDYANLLIEKNSRIEDNYSGSEGGGIYAYYGSLAIDHSQVVSNTASSSGGGIYADELGILVENSTVSWNESKGYSGGMYLEGWSVISNTHVSYNQSDGEGGGVEAYYGLHVENSTFEGNDANGGDGGAIYACESDYGYVSIVGSTFQDNRGDDGGAIYGYYYCGVQIQSSSFISNYASSDGGAIFTDEDNNLVVDRSTFFDNRADEDGGAIYSADNDGVANISQSTFSNNSAGTDGGALYLDYGGTIQHSTIVSNTADGDGGGLYQDDPTLIENSIIAGNMISGFVGLPNADCSSNNIQDVSSGGYNITGIDTGCMLLDIRDQHIMTGTLFTEVLGPLADNGGATKTHMPLADSPAIDGAPSLTCPKTDQRGEDRAQGNACDIGAVESSATGTVPTVAENVITVTTFDDELNSDSDCSLREAVTAANQNIAVDACPAGKPYSTTVDVIQLAAGEYFITGTNMITQSFTITNVESDSGPGFITVTEVITLSDNSNLTDDLDITETLTIRGAGMGLTTINGGESSRIFHVDPLDSDQIGVYLLLEDMKLTHGYVEDPEFFSYCCDVWVDGVYEGEFEFEGPEEEEDGGAILLEAGKLVLNRVDTFDNLTDDNGGAIYAEYGAVYLIDGTTIRNSYADQDGGAIYAEYAAVHVFDSTIRDNEADDGGGIYSEYGNVLIDQSSLKSNLANDGGGGVYAEHGIIVVRNDSLIVSNYAADEDGGGIQPEYGGAWVENSIFRDNFSAPHDYDGGAINAEDTALVVKNSLFEGNYAESGGAIDTEYGGLILNSEFRDNHAGDYGGAIYINEGVLFVKDSIFENNDAVEYGGAINGDESSIEIRNTVFRNNKVLSPGYYGGAIYVESYNGLTLRYTAFIENHSNGDGGAIYADDNPVIVENSTFESNTARQDGGGAIFDDYSADILNSTFSNNSAGNEGGALRLYVGTNINFSTIVNNHSANGGAVFYYDDSYHNVIQNSIVAGNSLTTRLANTNVNCLEGTGITSNGHNLFEANTGCDETPSDKLVASGDLMITELLPLADNDGHVLPDGSVIQTHALRSTSAAVNGAAETEVAHDQRGTVRPIGTTADIGAFEFLNAAPIAIDDPDITTNESEMVIISPLSNDSDLNSDNLMLNIIVTPSHGTAVISGTQVTYTPNPQFYGVDSFAYSASDGVLSDTAVVTVTVTQTSWEIYYPFTVANE
ncbi:MAG: choice-of-anchor Q domain-containing protein [Anaerolineae bacterium]